MGSLEAVELSECPSHLVEYAANRGLSRIPQMPRIKGSVLRYLPFFVLMGVGGQLSVVSCQKDRSQTNSLWYSRNCLNRGLSRITQMTRIIGGVMVVGGNCLKRDFCDLLIYGIVEGMGSCLKRDL